MSRDTILYLPIIVPETPQNIVSPTAHQTYYALNSKRVKIQSNSQGQLSYLSKWSHTIIQYNESSFSAGRLIQ